MPVDILIYMIVAAVMVFWLRNVLGTRHGEEKERPNPFEYKEQESDKTSDDKSVVLDMPVPQKETPSFGKDVDSALVQIALTDKNFEVESFKENASDAFTYIVSAFAEEDTDTLKDLCTDEVYDVFAAAIKDRQGKGEKVSTEIHAVRKAEITAASVDKKKQAFVTIRFTADETYVIEDGEGNLIAGHPDRVTEMTDKWTFTRNLKSSDPRWLLSKTEDDVIEEDGKTPLPDAG